MGSFLRRGLVVGAAAAVLFQPACLVRRRTVTPQGLQHKPLLTASKAELIQRVNAFSTPITTFSMKVDMAPSVGSLYGGTVTDYTSILGYILFRKPDQIRVIGLEPAIHGTAFDMASNGNEFRVSIPIRSQFFEGRNDAATTSPNKLENLRPAAFLTSLLIKPPNEKDATLFENDTNEMHARYILLIVERNGEQLKLSRNIYFDRYTLDISEQKTFDAEGEITSDTTYSNWKNYGDTNFPSTIDIQRPKDGYEVVLTVTELKINTADITAEKFVLNRPPGAQVKVLQ
jgi:outer membrane lipoprotein-sorting protein